MQGKTIIIAGTSGLVGHEILRLALGRADVSVVHSLGRRPALMDHPKLRHHTVDFGHMPPLPPADELYLALGTTINIAGNQAAFRAVDFDANLAVAQTAFTAGVRQLGLVSAMGADAGSRIFYNRIKGELEDALPALGFKGLVFARPSLLIGDRLALGQAARRGEAFGHTLGRLLNVLIPANYKPVAASAVAAALLAHVPLARGTEVLLSGQMRRP